jgi:hypothetical protein
LVHPSRKSNRDAGDAEDEEKKAGILKDAHKQDMR